MMKFSTTPISAEIKPVDCFEILQATENLNQAYMDLTDSQRNMTEVCDIMNNINTASKMIAQYKEAAIPMLNIDGGLESLLGIEEKLITVEKAQEGFSDAIKNAWKTFKEWVVKFFAAIKNWIKSIFMSDEQTAKDAEQNANAASKLNAEDQKEFLNKTPNKSASTESIDLKELRTNIIVNFKDMDSLIKSIENESDVIKNTKYDIPSASALLDTIKQNPEECINNIKDAVVYLGEEQAKLKSDIIKTTFNKDTLELDVQIIYAPAKEDKTLKELGWTVDNVIKFNHWYNGFAKEKKRRMEDYAKANDTMNAFLLDLTNKLESSDNENIKKFSATIMKLLRIQITMNYANFKVMEDINKCLKTHVKYFKGNLKIHS